MTSKPSRYEQRLPQTRQHKLWDKLDLSMRIGYFAIIALSLFAVLLEFFSPSWGLPVQMMSLLVIILTIGISTLVIPLVLLSIKLIRSALLWKAFQAYDEEIYKGGYMAFEMLKDFLDKVPLAHQVWLEKVLSHEYRVSWKDVHASVALLPIQAQIKWIWMWLFSEESYPQPNLSHLKTLPSNQDCWEALLGKDRIATAFVLQQKEVLSDTLPHVSILTPSKKPSRL